MSPGRACKVKLGVLMRINVGRTLRAIGVTSVVAALSACGGGGGGSNGGGGGGGSEGDSAYGVRALHAAIDGAPIDISSSAASSPLLSQQFFAGEKGYRSLPETGQTITLTRSGSPSNVYGSFAVTGAAQDKYTVLFYGDTTTFGLRSRLIKDDVPSTAGGSAIRVIHGATRAADVTVTVSGAAPEVVAFGQNTEYIPTTAGPVEVTVVRSSDGYPVRSGPLELKPGKAYTLLVAGEVGYYVKGVLFADS